MYSTIFSISTIAQFRSTSSSSIHYEIPKVMDVGDTSIIINEFSSDKNESYVLEKIEKNGRYVYRRLNYHGKTCIKINYDSNDRVQSYWYNYKSYGGNGKGYFVIHYYDNGNIKDYAQIMYSAINDNSEVVLYDSLGYREGDRSKIPYKEYTALKIRRKVFLSLELSKRNEIRRMKRNRKFRKPFSFQDAPFKFILIES